MHVSCMFDWVNRGINMVKRKCFKIEQVECGSNWGNVIESTVLLNGK